MGLQCSEKSYLLVYCILGTTHIGPIGFEHGKADSFKGFLVPGFGFNSLHVPNFCPFLASSPSIPTSKHGQVMVLIFLAFLCFIFHSTMMPCNFA